MKYLVMLGAKHTAKMPSLFISQNHTAEPMSIAITTSISQEKTGVVNSTAQGHTASKWLNQDSSPFHSSIFPSCPLPHFFFLFFLFCLLDIPEPPIFYSKFPSINSISISTLYPFRLFFCNF